MTHPVADLALEVAGGWWTRFTQILFRLQLLNRVGVLGTRQYLVVELTYAVKCMQ